MLNRNMWGVQAFVFDSLMPLLVFENVTILCSDDPDAGLDEGDVVRIAHAYKAVAGDTVSRLAPPWICFSVILRGFVHAFNALL